MSTAHTPGPWQFDASETDSRSRGYIRASDPDSDRLVSVARVTSSGRGHSEVLANARLIAAAPEMYKVLGRLELRLSAWAESEPLPDLHRDAIENVIQQARAVLAKAEGTK